MVPMTAPAELVSVPVRLPVAVRVPLTLENTILVSVPANEPPLATVPVTGAVTGAAVALFDAANAVGVMAIIAVSASADAKIGSLSFIQSLLEENPSR